MVASSNGYGTHWWELCQALKAQGAEKSDRNRGTLFPVNTIHFTNQLRMEWANFPPCGDMPASEWGSRFVVLLARAGVVRQVGISNWTIPAATTRFGGFAMCAGATEQMPAARWVDHSHGVVGLVQRQERVQTTTLAANCCQKAGILRTHFHRPCCLRATLTRDTGHPLR